MRTWTIHIKKISSFVPFGSIFISLLCCSISSESVVDIEINEFLDLIEYMKTLAQIKRENKVTEIHDYCLIAMLVRFF